MNFAVRSALILDVECLASLWHEGWHDAHASTFPAEVTAERTLGNFRERALASLDAIRTIGPEGRSIGFSIIKGDELNQFYVARSMRGNRVGSTLMQDVERQLQSANVETAWLDCGIGNERASRFYKKHGWVCVGVRTICISLKAGLSSLNVWRFERKFEILNDRNILDPPIVPALLF